MQQHSSTRRTVAMTLVEVLVALAIVSFVFSALTQMTFDSLKQAKKLELEDKMRNYATEAVQVLYNAKDTNWEHLFSSGVDAEGKVSILPPATSTITKTQAYLTYSENSVTLSSINLGNCQFDSTAQVLVGPSCEDTSANEDTAANRIFGRLIIRTDDNVKSVTESQDTENDADVEVLVACIEGKCDGKQFIPFTLNLKVYRTGGTQ